MKLKGIKPLEQHIEKIVLGVVLLALLAVVGMQFMLQPNNVEVSTTKSVPPESVYTELEGKAQSIDSKMKDLRPQLPEVASTDLVARYNEAFEGSSASTTQLSSALGQGVDLEDFFGGVTTVRNTGEVGALQVPSTSKPIALSSWSTLDPYALIEVPAYEAYVPSAQPFDFPSVSVEASFSGEELRAALTGENGGSTIPQIFWSQTGVTVLGFEIERQQLLGGGEWGASEPIETPPMTPLPTDAIVDGDGLPELTAVVSNAAGAFDEVVHPMFPPTIAGPEWAPPSERVEVDDSDLSEGDKVRRKLDRKENELARLEARPTTTGRPGPGGGGKTVTGGRDDPPQRPTVNRDRNKIKIDKLREEIEKLREELKEMGEDVDSDRGPRRGAKNMVNVLEMENIQLWAHDLGVRPGAEYRYRSRVVVNNPLFRKGPSLDANDEAQQALTKDPFARGGWSDWSDTVLVGAHEYYFVSNASPSGEHGQSPSANIELYKMYYGHYRKSSINGAQPGTKLELNAPVRGRMVTIDTAVLTTKEAGERLEEIQADTKASLPDGFNEVQGRLMIDLGVYLLDIALDPVPGVDAAGNAAARMQVTLRDAQGGVIVRSVSGKPTTAAYELVSESSGSASRTPLRAPGQSAVSPAYELFSGDSEP